MKRIIVISGMLSLGLCLWNGCGKSSPDSSESAKSTSAPAPTASPAVAPTQAPPSATTPAPVQVSSPTAVPTVPTANVTAAATQTTPSSALTSAPSPVAGTPPVPDQLASIKSSASDAVSQFATTAAGQTDQVAASIGSDLAAKARTLTQGAGTNPELKSQVTTALQSLSAGKDASALGTLFQQAKQANLTPQQSQMVKEVGNLASAYVVQRNFSSLDGAQGDVATIVNSLRKGSVMPAVPALQSLAQNASLTPQQKDLLGTLADQYAPGLKKASDSLKQGLQSLQGLTK